MANHFRCRVCGRLLGQSTASELVVGGVVRYSRRANLTCACGRVNHWRPTSGKYHNPNLSLDKRTGGAQN